MLAFWLDNPPQVSSTCCWNTSGTVSPAAPIPIRLAIGNATLAKALLPVLTTLAVPLANIELVNLGDLPIT